MSDQFSLLLREEIEKSKNELAQLNFMAGLTLTAKVSLCMARLLLDWQGDQREEEICGEVT